MARSLGYRFIKLLNGTNPLIGEDAPHVIIGDIIAIPGTVDYALTTSKTQKHRKATYNNPNTKTPWT